MMETEMASDTSDTKLRITRVTTLEYVTENHIHHTTWCKTIVTVVHSMGTWKDSFLLKVKDGW